MNNRIILLITIFFLLTSCQSIKDGLSGNKNENSDEFLIEKKNPLEIPPDFGQLPEPKKKKDIIDKAEKIDEDLEILIKKEKTFNRSKTSDESAEDFVLKQIKKN